MADPEQEQKPSERDEIPLRLYELANSQPSIMTLCSGK
jgi:hypothetical protein